MEALTIEIINPKAKKLLFNLADLNLISISKTSTIDSEFDDLLRKLRSKNDSIPSLNEITEEVEIIRTARYAE